MTVLADQFHGARGTPRVFRRIHIYAVKTVIVALLWIFTFPAHSFTVHDPLNFFQGVLRYSQLVKQIHNQVKGIEQTRQQITQMQRQYEMLSGSRQISRILNSSSVRDLRRVLPSDMQDTLNRLAAGVTPKDHQDLIRGLEALLLIYNVNDRLAKLTPEQASQTYKKLSQHRTNIAKVNVASANAALRQSTTTNLDNVEHLIDRIDQTEDLKASTDLNTRVVAENALLINQLIQLTAQRNIQTADSELQESARRETALKHSRIDFRAYREEKRRSLYQ